MKIHCTFANKIISVFLFIQTIPPKHMPLHKSHFFLMHFQPCLLFLPKRFIIYFPHAPSHELSTSLCHARKVWMEESEGASHGLLFLPGRSVHSRQAQKVYPSIFPPPASVLLCSGLGDEGKAANKFGIEMKRKLGHHAGISRVVRKGNKVIIFI